VSLSVVYASLCFADELASVTIYGIVMAISKSKKSPSGHKILSPYGEVMTTNC
jgi:hypothetical protein